MPNLGVNPNQNSEDKVRALITAGSDIAGASIGGACAYLLPGPVGAAAGAATGAVAVHGLRKIGEEVADRLLGPREKIRVGGALAIAAEKIRSRIERGECLRKDDFFKKKHNGRSQAEEVAESVLLKCQREAEERKIPYMAVLICNIAFDAQISPSLAHYIVKTAENLTYRQLCILKIAEFRDNYDLRQNDYRGQQRFEKPLYELLYEYLDLYNRALINFGGNVAFGPTDIQPGTVSVQGVGTDLFKQMSLATIPEDDLTPIVMGL